MLKFLTIKKIFLEFHENARSSNKILNDKEISNKKFSTKCHMIFIKNIIIFENI